MQKWILLMVCCILTAFTKGQESCYDLKEVTVTDESLVKLIDSMIYQLNDSGFRCKDNVDFTIIPHSIVGDIVLQFDAFCSDIPIAALSQYFFRHRGFIFYIDARKKSIDRFFSTTGKTEKFIVPPPKPVPKEINGIQVIEPNDDSTPVWMVIFRNNRFGLLTDWIRSDEMENGEMQWRDNEDTRYYYKIVFGVDI